ncbi:MAG TPA: GNAT family N-acetyltransferase [Actinophytocola sp.]|nr:GNAT family N-acetyltransferase [Actinophytocola sp.]
MRSWPREYLRRCLSGDGQEAVVASVAGELVGLASTGPVPDEPAVRELGVLVEDAWQRRGVGRLLTAALFARARSAGVRRIRLELCRLRPDLLDHVVTHLPVAARASDGCDVTVDVPVGVPVGAVVGAVAGWPADAGGVSPPPRSAPGSAPRPPSSGESPRGVRVRT